ncbi:T9SS type A sorting domain-containing protein [uncultured Lutibacter sp.]|uniref:T9SS type A sorting domain-containing protein n=1 Tax=uncultured Lutibacter sp. TaxID=437739 RepID=UPI00260C0C92|nr:T9SS type A sorting domain-containing protein [uncultured Lutibacter sp.]
MKKLLLITILLFSAFSFAQQNEKNTIVIKKNEPQATLSSISAYPNPFNVATKINFQSTIIQQIEFTVKNLLGKTVYIEQVNSKIGYNAILFNRDDLIKGMYIYTLQTETEVISKRIVIR